MKLVHMFGMPYRISHYSREEYEYSVSHRSERALRRQHQSAPLPVAQNLPLCPNTYLPGTRFVAPFMID